MSKVGNGFSTDEYLGPNFRDLENVSRNITYFIAKCEGHYCDEEAKK
jgi:hypothetical protein